MLELLVPVGVGLLIWLLAAGVVRAMLAAPSRRRRFTLQPLRYEAERRRRRSEQRCANGELREQRPYRFARRLQMPGLFGGKAGYLDMAGDGDEARLRSFGLPVFHTPEQLADWLEVPAGELAWLVHRYREGGRPVDVRDAHYAFRWQPKRSGGLRLIEAPKRRLKACQQRILDGLLSRIPLHPAAHGFVQGRSILTNAAPHVGKRVVVKLDLENFYASVRFNRVVAIFRTVGYSREAAIWLARLCTSELPTNLPHPGGDADALRPYRGRHLPQGAPTSPMLANLSAFSLDVRLAGLTRTFGGAYTRYADDLAFSGDQRFLRGLKAFLPLVARVVRSERFRHNARKRRVLRNGNRQTVTGVVVNAKPNVSRRDYDRLKATLFNCVKHGPKSQNREAHPAFHEHLRGRIAHVSQLNAKKGRKLLALYARIDWGR